MSGCHDGNVRGQGVPSKVWSLWVLLPNEKSDTRYGVGYAAKHETLAAMIW